MGVSGVQTGTLYIFCCQMKCAHYPDQALSKAGGFPCGYGWVRARVAGPGEPESASHVMEAFFCRAWETTPCETGLKKQQPKEVEMLIVQLPCTCIFFHPHNASLRHLKETAPTAPHPIQSADIVLSVTKAGM